jgi:hypothetical protein
MNWISVDIGKVMGVTEWAGKDRVNTYIVKPRGNQGKYYWNGQVVKSKLTAISCMIDNQDLVIMERGFGHLSTVINTQAHLRGYITCAADYFDMIAREINVSEWRRVVKEQMGVSFPRQSKDCKILAQQLVRKHYNLDATEDEADSVLIGYAAMKLGYVNI